MSGVDQPVPWSRRRQAVLRDAVGVGVATGAYGISFGAVAVAGGLTVAQTSVSSLLVFTGASQFALVGVLAQGGSVSAAAGTAILLGGRNALYGLGLARLLDVRGARRLGAAHLVIDESTAMAFAHQDDERAARLAFWATGAAVFVLWNAATLAGAVLGSRLADPAAFGLDGAVPAAFLALLWPRLASRAARAVAGTAAVAALVLVPVLPAGLPIVLAAAVAAALALGLRWQVGS
jgi:predicted branched-subunit amino acid permease